MIKNLMLLLLMILPIGCDRDAQVASRNLSQASDMFEVTRRIVFYNGITSEYILSIEGLCSLERTTTILAVTCKTGKDTYKKHYLGISDNVTFFAEQLSVGNVSTSRYRVIFKPSTIIPNVELN